MISLGIIGEYLARIYEEVKGRPRYLIKELIEPNPVASVRETRRESALEGHHSS
jgi:polyisoprenyl-phosphate glycosyltransferase